MEKAIQEYIRKLDSKLNQFLITRKYIGKFERAHDTRGRLRAAISRYNGYFRRFVSHAKHEQTELNIPEGHISVEKYEEWGQPIIHALDDVQNNIITPMLTDVEEINTYLNQSTRRIFGEQKVAEYVRESQEFMDTARALLSDINRIAGKYHHWLLSEDELDDLLGLQKATYAHIRAMTELVKELKEYTTVALEPTTAARHE